MSSSRLRPGPPAKAPLSVEISILPYALSVQAAARALGDVTPWFVEELCRSGEIEYHVLGNQRVIEPAELARWFKKQPTMRGKLQAPTLVTRKAA